MTLQGMNNPELFQVKQYAVLQKKPVSKLLVTLPVRD